MLKISAHQINTVIGDIDGNYEKIVNLVKKDIELGSNVSVFPETAITGYTCGSLWDRLDFVKKQQEMIYSLKNLTEDYHTIIIGFASYNGVNRAGFPKLKNSVAVINAGHIDIYHKQLLANNDHHEDRKYFTPGDYTKVFNINTGDELYTIGVPICEDAWYPDHSRNIPEEMVNKGAQILISINQSYFYYGKQSIRYKLFKSIAINNNVPVVMVNSNGLGDIVKNILIFDGGSMVINKHGQVTHKLDNHIEGTITIDFDDIDNYATSIISKRSKYKEIFDALVYEQKEFFRLCGIPNAQVHLSGGLDSSIVAAIVTTAMGPEHTIFITNPSNLNETSKSFEYAKYTAEKLKVPLYINPIQGIYDKMKSVDENSFAHSGLKIKDTGLSTMHAVLRTVQGLAATHRFNSGIVSTGNHTENVLGWASFHDIGSIGVHQPIGDMAKQELFEFAYYINHRIGNVIPEALYDGKFKPAAELPDAMEDPINYVVQSGICSDFIRDRKTKRELIEKFDNQDLNPDYYKDSVYNLDHNSFEDEVEFSIKQMVRSVYKNAQSAPIVVISPRSRGFSSRETLINKYNYK